MSMDQPEQLSRTVIDAIQRQGLSPIPRSRILFQRFLFWASATASVLIGAVSFSVAQYIFLDSDGVSAQTLIETPLEGVLQGIPFLWLGVFAFFAATAYLSLRKTRTGYRYRTSSAIAGVLACTIVLGLTLSLFDFGHAVYYYLSHHVSFLQAVIQSNDDISF